MFQAELG